MQAELLGNGDPWPLEPPAGLQWPEETQHIPRRRVLRRGSVVCAATECVLGGVLACLGDGSPDTGDRLVSDGSMFDEVSAHIASLVPGDGWQGLAAQAYSAQNLAQSQRAKVIGDLDQETGDLVSAQAEAVQEVRYVVVAEIATAAATLAFCIYAETTMGPTGQILSLHVAVPVCTVAIAVLAGFLIDLAITTSRNASKAQEMAQRLAEMVTSLPTLPDATRQSPDVSFPSACCPSDFDAADHTLAPSIAGRPKRNGPPPETPDVSLVFADLPGSPEFSVPAVATPGFPDFGVPHVPIPILARLRSSLDIWSALATFPSLGLADLPTVATQPPMAQLAAPLAQLAGLSGQLAHSANSPTWPLNGHTRSPRSPSKALSSRQLWPLMSPETTTPRAPPRHTHRPARSRRDRNQPLATGPAARQVRRHQRTKALALKATTSQDRSRCTVRPGGKINP
ncbi:hypothetical protein I547_3663 [Mycobacterium kansasii 824]|nr:hypothetical protein I547_3663 [Mycobacterium kansasii 824]